MSRPVSANLCAELDSDNRKSLAGRKTSLIVLCRFKTRRIHLIFAPVLSEKDFKSSASG
jgi:hypothetical protein